jgi:hypothetical protein
VEQPATTDNTPETRPLGGGIIQAGTDDVDGPEDASQADARSTFVSASDLPEITEAEPDKTPGTYSTPETNADNIGLEKLRQELNRQFEGIHIVAPGKYELNLMELFRREECIITLRADGKYDIGLPNNDFSLEEE